jgi:predicted outer membrane repeat protein
MWFSHWLRKRTANRVGRSTQPGARARCRPQLELLEDRWLPSSFTVQNLNDHGAGSLRAAINAIDSANAATVSTIDFAPSVTGTIVLTTGPLNIFANMEIDGPGAALLTISGQNKTSVFAVNFVTQATINDLTIANGKALDGGGIVDGGGALNLSRVTFQNNQASEGGGALEAGSATVTVTDSRFIGNRVVAPYGTFSYAVGGAIFSDNCFLTVDATSFTNNSVTGANAFSGGSTRNIEPGKAAGGAVYAQDDLQDTFSGDTFTGNKALGGKGCSGSSGRYTIGEGQGGAIEIDGSNVEIDQSNFDGNLAQGGYGNDVAGGGRIGFGMGGAIDVRFTGGQLTVIDSGFLGNHALGASGGFALGASLINQGLGGAINAEGADTSLTIAGSSFITNTAMGGGNGSFVPSPINIGGDGRGGAISLRASADISDCSFTSNVALGGNGTNFGSGGNGSGGAIDALPTSLTISNSHFVTNRAQGGRGGTRGGDGGSAQGGGLSCEGDAIGMVTLLDLFFSSNRAIGGSGFGQQGGTASGGGLSLVGEIVYADNLTVESNLVQGGAGLNGANGGNADGGGIYLNSADSNVSCTIADSLVTLNNAVGGVATFVSAISGAALGGGIDAVGITLSLPNTTVQGNLPNNIVS